MGLRIQTNSSSLTAQRSLNESLRENETALERLSSGYRINRAADDAAGLAISEHMRSDLASLAMAKRNANDGISLVQTAEGSLSDISTILIRLKELAVQAASDTITDNEREFIELEFGALKDEIDRTTRVTEFNGTYLLAGDQNESELPSELFKNSNKSPLNIQVGKSYYDFIDDSDEFSPVNVINIDLRKFNTNTSEHGLDIGSSKEKDRASVISVDMARKSLTSLEDAINKVSSYRAALGAIQNRLTSTTSLLGIRIENTASTNSRIRDTDFAEETARLIKSDILKATGSSVLAQANHMPEIALKLIG